MLQLKQKISAKRVHDSATYNMHKTRATFFSLDFIQRLILCMSILYSKYIPNLRFTVYSLRCSVYCLWFMVYGLRFTVYGLRFTFYGLRFTVYE